jgi:hypothetical protein
MDLIEDNGVFTICIISVNITKRFILKGFGVEEICSSYTDYNTVLAALFAGGLS